MKNPVVFFRIVSWFWNIGAGAGAGTFCPEPEPPKIFTRSRSRSRSRPKMSRLRISGLECEVTVGVTQLTRPLALPPRLLLRREAAAIPGGGGVLVPAAGGPAAARLRRRLHQPHDVRRVQQQLLSVRRPVRQPAHTETSLDARPSQVHDRRKGGSIGRRSRPKMYRLVDFVSSDVNR